MTPEEQERWNQQEARLNQLRQAVGGNADTLASRDLEISRLEQMVASDPVNLHNRLATIEQALQPPPTLQEQMFAAERQRMQAQRNPTGFDWNRRPQMPNALPPIGGNRS